MENNVIIKVKDYRELAKLTVLIDKIIKARAKVLKLQPDVARAAFILAEENEIADVAEALKIRQEGASHLVRELERNGMVETDKTAGGYRRRIRLTSTGRKLLIEPITKKIAKLIGDSDEEKS